MCLIDILYLTLEVLFSHNYCRTGNTCNAMWMTNVQEQMSASSGIQTPLIWCRGEEVQAGYTKHSDTHVPIAAIGVD